MTTGIQYLVAAVSLGGLYALFALGIALIFGIMRLVNFAHGELMMIGGYTLILLSGRNLLLLGPVTVGVVVIAALIMERVAFRPVRGANPTTLLITSFALSFLLQNVASVIFGSLPFGIDVSPVFSGEVVLAGVAIARLQLITIGVLLVLLIGLGAFLSRTNLGIQMRAAAEDFQMARLLGVRANTVISVAFAISGGLAGVASLLLVAQTGIVSPILGVSPVLIAFAATIVGGMGSLIGAVLGGFLLGIVSVAFQIALPLGLRSYRDAFVFGLVFVVLVARPRGLVISKSVATRV